MNDSKPPRLAIDLSSERVNYHSDTIEYLVTNEILRCKQNNIPLTRDEINKFRTELVKTLLIRHQAEKAVNLRIKEKK
jgi:hypothetical protein